jgi:hypothetical protein
MTSQRRAESTPQVPPYRDTALSLRPPLLFHGVSVLVRICGPVDDLNSAVAHVRCEMFGEGLVNGLQ